MPSENDLFLVYMVDCEPLAAKSPACGGPASWSVSEKAIRQYAEIFGRNDMLCGLSFHTTPEAGKAHRDQLLDLHGKGCDLGLQLNVPGFDYPKYELDLGYYDREEQEQILRSATDTFTETFGFRPETYTPCCGSKSKHTYPLLVSLGYKQTHSPVTGRYLPDRPDRCTMGCFPYPHWANAAHQLIAGTLPLLVIPGTGDISFGRGNRPFDLRPESPPTPETRAHYRKVIDEAIEIQQLIGQPVKVIASGSHNTGRVNFENVEYVVEYTAEAARRAGLRLVPANCTRVREAAEQLMPATG